MQKIILILFLASCSRYKTPDLPDLQKETFSTEDILQKQKELEERIEKISE
ncbi:MAG: hypothetical protein LBB21_06730 [Holosporaceae bacterium]|jgi:hypothetical protein|nr:hypothetical protein [Holosporaceae bacterium]